MTKIYLLRPKAREPIAHVWESNELGPLCRVVDPADVRARPDRWKIWRTPLGARPCKLCEDLEARQVRGGSA